MTATANPTTRRSSAARLDARSMRPVGALIGIADDSGNMRTFASSLGECVEADQGGSFACLADQGTDQVHRAELGVGHGETRGMSQEVEGGSVLDRPPEGTTEGLEKPV